MIAGPTIMQDVHQKSAVQNLGSEPKPPLCLDERVAVKDLLNYHHRDIYGK